MRTILVSVTGVLALAAGIGGRWLGWGRFAPYASWLLAAGAAAVAMMALRQSYRPSGTPWPTGTNTPARISLQWHHYVKAMVCWLDAFKHTYAIEPGLYYTGEHYDREAPLLITANYLLTVLLVVRRVRHLGVRLLIVDTDGINVWCAAGKGKLDNEAIETQLGRYPRELLTGSKFLTLVLPKLAFAGVNLRALRRAKIRPIIGPIYAKDLPAFLADGKLRDCDGEHVRFGLRSRVFTWLPGLIQYLAYALLLAAAMFGVEQLTGRRTPTGLVALMAVLATAYPLLFPHLPGARFAIKGLWLAAATALGLGAMALAGVLPPASLWAAVPFTFATALFVGLSYTGNSAVSNYSRVRREIARFLPLTVLLYLVSLTAFLMTEVAQ